MSAPLLTIHRGGERTRTFTPGPAVVIGRSSSSDLWITHPSVSRSHMVVCHTGIGWVAIDNRSLNGVFIGGWQVYAVDIRGGETINLGHPRGPALTFVLSWISVDRSPPTLLQGRLRRFP